MSEYFKWVQWIQKHFVGKENNKAQKEKNSK